jgi:hypothetical protein
MSKPDTFESQDSTEMGMNEIERIHKSMSHADVHDHFTSELFTSEEYLNTIEVVKGKEYYKADPHRLKRDIEINENVKELFGEAKEATPAEEILSCHTISADHDRADVTRRLIQALPNWSLSDSNSSYDLKKYLSREVRSVYVDIIPDDGVLQFDPEKWVMSHKASNLECQQFVVAVHACVENAEDLGIFFAYNGIEPLPPSDNEYKCISLLLEQRLISSPGSGSVFGNPVRKNINNGWQNQVTWRSIQPP